MKSKTFRGEIHSIEDATFTSSDGSRVVAKRLKILLNDEKGLSLFVSSIRDKEVYDRLSVNEFFAEMIVDVTVVQDINNDGTIKLIPINIQEVEPADVQE